MVLGQLDGEGAAVVWWEEGPSRRARRERLLWLTTLVGRPREAYRSECGAVVVPPQPARRRRWLRTPAL
jgi:hypothetical protein